MLPHPPSPPPPLPPCELLTGCRQHKQNLGGLALTCSKLRNSKVSISKPKLPSMSSSTRSAYLAASIMPAGQRGAQAVRGVSSPGSANHAMTMQARTPCVRGGSVNT